MRIGEVARRSGLSRDTIRFYERERLIASAESREPSNTYRDYPPQTIERLEMIVQARDVGLTVPDLRRLFQGLDGMATDAFDAEAFLAEKIADVRARIDRCERLLILLHAARDALAPVAAADERRKAWLSPGKRSTTTTRTPRMSSGPTSRSPAFPPGPPSRSRRPAK